MENLIEDTKNLEKELEELKDGWGKGSFSDKEEVGADSLLQYLGKAKVFSKNLRGAKKKEGYRSNKRSYKI